MKMYLLRIFIENIWSTNIVILVYTYLHTFYLPYSSFTI